MGFLVVIPITAILLAIGAGMSALMGLFMALATTIVTSMIGFIAFLLVLI